MPDGPVLRCGSCGGADLVPVLDLGMQPLPQAMPGRGQGSRYPLRLVKCSRCMLVQLDYIVPQTELFPADYPYATGNTRALLEHFEGLAHDIASSISARDLVVDIGGNDGTLLRALTRRDRLGADGEWFRPRCLLIEPTDQAKKASEDGIDVVQDYWTAELGQRIRETLGPAKVIVTSNTFGHVPDPHDFLNGVMLLLASHGTLIIENQDWQNVVNSLQIDTIYHEHLRYYSPASLSFLLEQHGLLATGWTRIPMHGGSFRVTAVRQEPDLQSRAMRLASMLSAILAEAAQKGPVYAIGAPTRATPLVNYAGIGRYLDCACEITGSGKIGALIPGTDVPVVDEIRLFTDQPPHALLLAWDLKDSVVPVLRKRGYCGKIIVPLPVPGIVDD